jgi:WD40 repeat protein
MAAFVTLLDGRVMIIGGRPSGSHQTCTARVEIVDARRGTSTEVTPTKTARCRHTATLLPDGSVLVIGGDRSTTEYGETLTDPGTAERWDPASGTWGAAGTLALPREGHAATLLPDGRVLVVGGNNRSKAPAEVWESGRFRSAGIPGYRNNPLAFLRSDGRVVVAFGDTRTVVDIWDPATEAWSTASSVPDGYGDMGRVVSLGGDEYLVGDLSGNVKKWNSLTNEWTDVGSDLRVPPGGRATWIGEHEILIGSMIYDVQREVVSAADTPSDWERYRVGLGDGSVLSVGIARTWLWTLGAAVSGTWTDGHPIPFARLSTLAPIDDDRMLMAGGWVPDADLSRTLVVDDRSGSWDPTAGLRDARQQHVSVTLSDGRVLVAGGKQSQRAARPRAYSSRPSGRTKKPLELDTIEVWDPVTARWSSGGRMEVPRQRLTASVLDDGRVLLVGGEASQYAPTEQDGYWTLEEDRWAFNVAEVWDPQTGKPSMTGRLKTARAGHAAVVLQDGRVLATGGHGGPNGVTETGEIWDPATGRWSDIAPMHDARVGHTATLLSDGRVLVVGGGATASAEIWDPNLDAWSSIPVPPVARTGHRAVRLADGRVLVAGGTSNARDCDGTAEVWDPGAASWSKAANLPSCIDDLVAFDDRVVATTLQQRAGGGIDGLCTATFVPSEGAP